MNRFDRQIQLPGFGPLAQERLQRARVLVVGAGGLGCPVLLYLAAAGVGHLGIADGDRISVSNLNRQVLFGLPDVGLPKAATAAQRLQTLYPDVRAEAIPTFLDTTNALEYIGAYDVVVDASDNFPTRYLVNDACVLLRKPLVMGAIYQYEGQVMVLNAAPPFANYRDLHPTPPAAGQVPDCELAGVLGVLPGIIGTMMAAEVIKLMTAGVQSGMKSAIANQVLYYRLADHSTFQLAISSHPQRAAAAPASPEEFRAHEYGFACGPTEVIGWKQAIEWAASRPDCRLVDLREPGELPAWSHPSAISLPISALLADPGPLAPFRTLMLVCQSGKRSLQMVAHLQKQFPDREIFSVEGGILHPEAPLHQ